MPDALNASQLAESAMQIWQWLIRLDEPLKARAFLENLPYCIEDHPGIVGLRSATRAMLCHLESNENYENFYESIWESDAPPHIPGIFVQGHRNLHAKHVLQRLAMIQARTVTDLGSGSGFMPLFIAAHGFQVTAVNLTSRAVDAGNEVAGRLGLPAHFIRKRAEYYRGDVTDVVMALEIIEHVPDPELLVLSMEENVRPGGMCILTTPNGSTTLDAALDYSAIVGPKAHVRAFTEQSVRRWLGSRPGFALEVVAGPAAGSLFATWGKA